MLKNHGRDGRQRVSLSYLNKKQQPKKSGGLLEWIGIKEDIKAKRKENDITAVQPRLFERVFVFCDSPRFPLLYYTISTRWCGCNRTRCVGVSLACCITSPRIQQTKFGRIRSSRWDLFWNNCLFARNGVATLAVSTWLHSQCVLMRWSLDSYFPFFTWPGSN